LFPSHSITIILSILSSTSFIYSFITSLQILIILYYLSTHLIPSYSFSNLVSLYSTLFIPSITSFSIILTILLYSLSFSSHIIILFYSFITIHHSNYYHSMLSSASQNNSYLLSILLLHSMDPLTTTYFSNTSYFDVMYLHILVSSYRLFPKLYSKKN
jgi:hypothetical protein